MDCIKQYSSTSVDWKPSAVVALATSPDGSQVAAAREDGSLEIWLVSAGAVGWHCQLTIHGDPRSRVTSLVWCWPSSKNGGVCRLLSSGIDGTVSEWDLFSLKQEIILDTMVFTIWQMALEPLCFLDSAELNSTLPSNGYGNDSGHSDSESCQSEAEDDDTDFNERQVSTPDKRSQYVALACSDGCIRLYDASEGFTYRRSFPRVSGQVLSIAWSLDSKHLFSGSSDGLIRCWNATSAQEYYRITAGLGSVGSHDELCVWSLLFLRCGTLVSADSTGSVQFWDSHHGTLLQAHSYHVGDAKALAASPNHENVYSGGSDGKVILYTRSIDTSSGGYAVENEAMYTWTYVKGVAAHTHDVRALTVAVPISSEGLLLESGKRLKKIRRQEKPIHFSYLKWARMGVPMLLSAGDDTKIFAFSANDFTKYSPHDICPAPQRVPVHLAINVRCEALMLLQYSDYLNILSVEQCGSESTDLKANTKSVAHIKCRESRKIISSAISSTGLLVAYSDNTRPSLFELKREKGLKPMYSLSKRKLPSELPFAHSMIFSADSSCMVLAGRDRKLYVVDVERLKLLHTFVPCRKQADMNFVPSEPPITKMFTSSDGQWLAAINCFGDIYIFNLETYRQHWFIARLDGASVTAGGFHPVKCNVLVIATSSNQVHMFDVDAKEVGEWSRRHSSVLPRRFQEFPGHVIGMFFPSFSSTSAIIYSARAMCLVNFGMPFDKDEHELPNGSDWLMASPWSLKSKRKKEHGLPGNFEFLFFDHPTLFVGQLSRKSLFLLQKPWKEVIQTFDAPVHRHTYGT